MSLDAALRDIERMFGAGSVVTLESTPQQIPALSTGAIQLDEALGIGGLPLGRIVEIYGPESSGKTTLVLSVMAQAQRQGKRVALIDAEHALDPGYASAVGCKPEEFILSQPDSAEQGLEIAHRLILSGEVAVVAVDSVAALVPQAELAGEMGQQQVGLQARLMGQAMRKLVPAAKNTGTLVIFTNQIREKVGVMFGSPETTPGGRALKFAASARLDVRCISRGEDGNRTKVTVRKNKVGAPHKVAEFDIRFGEGIDSAGCVIDKAIEDGRCKKTGGWHLFADDKGQVLGKVNGRQAAREFVIEQGWV